MTIQTSQLCVRGSSALVLERGQDSSAQGCRLLIQSFTLAQDDLLLLAELVTTRQTSRLVDLLLADRVSAAAGEDQSVVSGWVACKWIVLVG